MDLIGDVGRVDALLIDRPIGLLLIILIAVEVVVSPDGLQFERVTGDHTV